MSTGSFDDFEVQFRVQGSECMRAPGRWGPVETTHIWSLARDFGASHPRLNLGKASSILVAA